jgi:hypothetical protein
MMVLGAVIETESLISLWKVSCSRHVVTGRCMIGIVGVESRSLPSGQCEVVCQVTYWMVFGFVAYTWYSRC